MKLLAISLDILNRISGNLEDVQMFFFRMNRDFIQIIAKRSTVLGIFMFFFNLFYSILGQNLSSKFIIFEIFSEQKMLTMHTLCINNHFIT